MVKLRESLEENRKQMMLEVQEQMERMRQQSANEMEVKEKELAAARLSLAQQQQNNREINRRVDRILARMVAIQSVEAQGSLVEKEPVMLES